MDISKYLRVIPDFPKPGIQFRDVTSFLERPVLINHIKNALQDHYRCADADRIVAVESRGFIFSAIMADRLHSALVLARKKGKLPPPVISQEYNLEYGSDTIEIREGAIKEGDVVIIHDDLLATGGTALAVYKLVKQFKPSKIYFSFLVEIRDEGLKGREFLQEHCPDTEVFSLVTVG